MSRKYTHKTSTEQRFWSKVAITADDNQCWEWLAGKNAYGYGFTKVGKERIASRIAWSYPDYVIPKYGEIRHTCDNPSCCNPKHLILGTHLENMEDMRNKGRSLKGRVGKRRRLTKEQELELVKRYCNERISQVKLAKEYDIAEYYVWRLVRFLK